MSTEGALRYRLSAEPADTVVRGPRLAPLAATIPGLQRYTVSRPGPDADGNQPLYHLVAVLEFESEAAFGAGMSGPEGQAAVADLPNFAGAGTTMLTGEATTV